MPSHPHLPSFDVTSLQQSISRAFLYMHIVRNTHMHSFFFFSTTGRKPQILLIIFYLMIKLEMSPYGDLKSFLILLFPDTLWTFQNKAEWVVWPSIPVNARQLGFTIRYLLGLASSNTHPLCHPSVLPSNHIIPWFTSKWITDFHTQSHKCFSQWIIS